MIVLLCYWYTGELEVASAKNVVLYTSLSNKGQEEESCLCGLLVVTNFKLSFLTRDDDQVRNLNCHRKFLSFSISLEKKSNQFLKCNYFLQNVLYQENLYLQRNDVTLQNIDQIYQIIDRKKRLVNPYSKINPKLEGLQIVCKVWHHQHTAQQVAYFDMTLIYLVFHFQNFRVLKFGFKRSEVGQGKRIAQALTKFAFPNQHDLLFTYKFE